jgi:hypothetical protein
MAPPFSLFTPSLQIIESDTHVSPSDSPCILDEVWQNGLIRAWTVGTHGPLAVPNIVFWAVLSARRGAFVSSQW